MEVFAEPGADGEPNVATTAKVTVQLVQDPGLARNSAPAEPINSQAQIGSGPENSHEIQVRKAHIFVAATIFDGTRSHIKIYPEGKHEGEVEAWSNIDFNLFGGTGKMLVSQEDGTTEEVTIVISIENVDTSAQALRAASRGLSYQAPQIPVLPDIETGGASFSVIQGVAEDSGMGRLEQLHDLYRSGHEKLEQAYAGVLAARAAREAGLQLNPPPTDIKVSFWNKDAAAAGSQKQGGEGR